MSGALPIAMVVGEYAIMLAIAVYILVRSRGSPAVRLAWLVVVFAVPVIGVIAFLLVGEVRIGRRRAERHRLIAARMTAKLASYPSRPLPIDALIPEDYRPLAHLAETVGGNRPRGGHNLRLFGDTDLFIESLVEDIEKAELHCHLLFYIFLTDGSGTRVAEALAEAAERGVDSRLLVDGVGSRA